MLRSGLGIPCPTLTAQPSPPEAAGGRDNGLPWGSSQIHTDCATLAKSQPSLGPPFPHLWGELRLNTHEYYFLTAGAVLQLVLRQDTAHQASSSPRGPESQQSPKGSSNSFREEIQLSKLPGHLYKNPYTITRGRQRSQA